MEEMNSLQKMLDATPAERMIAFLPGGDAIILHDGEKELGRIPFDQILDIELFDDSTAKRQTTWSRFFLLGPLAFFIPKKTIQESFRIRIRWKDHKGEYQENDISLPSKTMAEYRYNTLLSWKNPETRHQMAEKAKEAARIREASELMMKQERARLEAAQPFVTCRGCFVEFRRSDLPPGGKCPVCGKRLKLT